MSSAPISPPVMAPRTGSIAPNNTLRPDSGHVSPELAAPMPLTVGTKRKHPQDSRAGCEADHFEERASRRPRTSPLELSRENLRILEILSQDSMDNNVPLKRTSSRRSVAASDTGTDRTRNSITNNAVYRHKNLAAVEIYMHADPPDHIEAAVDRIVNAPVSDDRERRSQLRAISQKFRDNCLANVKACALKIQLDLDAMVDRASTSSDTTASSDIDPTLFFSVTTQGPIHELWVHWTVVNDGVRMFNAKLLDSCNALLLQRGEGFIGKLYNLCRWGTGRFLESVAARLGTVASKAVQ